MESAKAGISGYCSREAMSLFSWGLNSEKEKNGSKRFSLQKNKKISEPYYDLSFPVFESIILIGQNFLQITHNGITEKYLCIHVYTKVKYVTCFNVFI